MSLSTLRDLKHLPGDEGLPIFGHLFKYMSDATGFYQEQRRKYGDIYKVHTIFGSSIVLSGPTANKLILVENARHTSNREAWETALSDLFPNGLMLMDGERHKYHRAITNEAFKKVPMQGYLDDMPDIISKACKGLEGKKKVLIFPFMKNLTLSLAARVFFGISNDKDLKKINKAISDVVNAALALPINLPSFKYRKGIKGRILLENYFKSIIGNRRQYPGKDLFSRLCHAKSEAGDQFTDTEIIDHMIFVLMASHDTTAITLSLMTYFIAKYPLWQEKIRSEISGLDKFGNIKVNDLRQLEFTGLVMKETLRLHPPLITVVRKLEKEFVIDQLRIPKNTMVNIVFQSTHTDHRVWSNPQQFDPDRFNAVRKEQSRCPFAYAPFGAGPHHCIGYSFAEIQVKLVITELLRHFRLHVPAGYECPIADLPLKYPKDDLPIFFSSLN